MGDKNFSAGNGKFDQIVGGSGATFDGAMYFPNSNLKFAGSSSTSGYTVIVADNVTITGNILSDVLVNVHLDHARGVVMTGNTCWTAYEHNLLVENSTAVVIN